MPPRREGVSSGLLAAAILVVLIFVAVGTLVMIRARQPERTEALPEEVVDPFEGLEPELPPNQHVALPAVELPPPPEFAELSDQDLWREALEHAKEARKYLDVARDLRQQQADGYVQTANGAQQLFSRAVDLGNAYLARLDPESDAALEVDRELGAWIDQLVALKKTTGL